MGGNSIILKIIVAAGFLILAAAIGFLLMAVKEHLLPSRTMEDFEDDEEDEDEDDEEAQKEEAAAEDSGDSAADPEPEAQENTAAEEPEGNQETQDVPLESEEVYYMDDILDSAKFLGHRLDTSGISPACISMNGQEVLTEGNLFGAKAYGGIRLIPTGTALQILGAFYVTCHDMAYDVCLVKMIERFGPPIDAGEQENNGVKSTYCAFSCPEGTLWLSREDGASFFNINLS